MKPRIWLSPPEQTGKELDHLKEALESNWLAPVGPKIDAFEEAMKTYVGREAALALNSGTSAIHLALRELGVKAGDTVVCPTLTYVATANPVRYLGAEPIFIDSAANDYHMDPSQLERCLAEYSREGKLPKAVIVAHIYGLAAPMKTLVEVCDHYGVPVIEDAAEALGVKLGDKQAGSFGQFSILSFNGNKLITTSSGGMLLSNDAEKIDHARSLAMQARVDKLDYQHAELGYNYRMSNLLAAVGMAQFEAIEEKIEGRIKVFEEYQKQLGEIPGITFMRERSKTRATRWLTTIHIDEAVSGVSREIVQRALTSNNIESRPVWKPLHLQPLYEGSEFFGNENALNHFQTGLCLPSGNGMTPGQFSRIISTIEGCFKKVS